MRDMWPLNPAETVIWLIGLAIAVLLFIWIASGGVTA